MDISKSFGALFNSEASRKGLSDLGHHISLPTFNLSTSSLRHLSKWYDRLSEIDRGIKKSHPNYLSDPEAIGLVFRTKTGGKLTRAGKIFLATRSKIQLSPERSEYELIKTLYYSDIKHNRSAADFLSAKRQNLYSFLERCHITPNSGMLLTQPKLLAIGEALAGFPGALEGFLRLNNNEMMALLKLGESGFQSLSSGAKGIKGFDRLVHKIASDYTRAEERRLHYLMAMLLNEIRADLSRNERQIEELKIPRPYSNLVTPEILARHSELYTDDFRIIQSEGQYVSVLASNQLPSFSLAQVIKAGLRIPSKRIGQRSTTGHKTRIPQSGKILIDLPLAKEAEDYVEKYILNPKHHDALVRVGHSSKEMQTLVDGLLPGADFYSVNPREQSPTGFFEVKSSIEDGPSSIRITRGEYQRAKKCFDQKIPYEVFVVIFSYNLRQPTIYHIQNFAEICSKLTIDDLISFEIGISSN